MEERKLFCRRHLNDAEQRKFLLFRFFLLTTIWRCKTDFCSFSWLFLLLQPSGRRPEGRGRSQLSPWGGEILRQEKYQNTGTVGTLFSRVENENGIFAYSSRRLQKKLENQVIFLNIVIYLILLCYLCLRIKICNSANK